MQKDRNVQKEKPGKKERLKKTYPYNRVSISNRVSWHRLKMRKQADVSNVISGEWRKKCSKHARRKAAQSLSFKLLKKGTGVNCINIVHKIFSYKRCLCSFFYVHVTRVKLPKQLSYEKFVGKMLMKLTTGEEREKRVGEEMSREVGR